MFKQLSYYRFTRCVHLEFACANVDGQETLCRIGDLKTAVENVQFAAQNISACVIDAQHDFQSVVRDTFAVLRQITCCVETIIYHDYCTLFSPSRLEIDVISQVQPEKRMKFVP